MLSKKDSIGTVLDGIHKAAAEKEYNIMADLELLRKNYLQCSRKNFLKLIEALKIKYGNEEAAEIHAALVAKARAGDVEAIRLWQQSRAGSGADQVVIIDDIS